MGEGIAEIFGEEIGAKVEEFLIQQAQLGIKRNDLQKIHDPKERDQLEKDIAARQVKMDDLRLQDPVLVLHYGLRNALTFRLGWE